MAQASDPDGEGEEEATEEYYAYDQTPFWTRGDSSLGRSGNGVPSPFGRGAGGEGSQMLFRFTGPNTADLADRYLWAPVVDMLLSDEKLTGPSTPGDIYWTLGDNLNTVRDIARYNPATDTTTIVNHRVFDAFGNITSETNAAVDLLFAFTGRLFDESTGLQNNLHRWYDPTIGRWLSEDPIGFNAGDANPYRYCGNQPTGPIDPTGLFYFYRDNMNPTQVATLQRVETEAITRMRLWLKFLSPITYIQAADYIAGRGFRGARPNGRTVGAFASKVSHNTEYILKAMQESEYTLRVDAKMRKDDYAQTHWGSGGFRPLPALPATITDGDIGKGVDYISFNKEKFFKASFDKQIAVFVDEMSHYACRTRQDENWVQPRKDIEASVGVDKLYADMAEKGKDAGSVERVFWRYVDASITSALTGGRTDPRGD